MVKRIIVNRSAERGFRRRALSKYPLEHLEALWGKIVGESIHIYAFMPISHRSGKTWIYYDEEEYADQKSEAKDMDMVLLGSIHSHPDSDDCCFSPTDLRDCQDTQDAIMAICAIKKTKTGKPRSKIEYWPVPRPIKIKYL